MHQISCPFSIAVVVPNDQSRSQAHVSVSCLCQFLRWGVISTSPNPQAEVSHLVSCPRLLIHSQPVDAPCCGDKDPPIMDIYIYIYIYAPPRFSRPGLTNLLYPCPKWHAEMFPWQPALFAVPIFLNLFFPTSFSKLLRTCTVIPRLTKIIRSGITFVSRNLR